MNNTMTGQYTFFTDGLMIIAQLEEGQLISSTGKVVKTEQIEMDSVKVTHQGEEQFFALGEFVRWMPETEVLS